MRNLILLVALILIHANMSKDEQRVKPKKGTHKCLKTWDAGKRYLIHSKECQTYRRNNEKKLP